MKRSETKEIYAANDSNVSLLRVYEFELSLTSLSGSLYFSISQKIGLKFKKYFLNCFSKIVSKTSTSLV